MASKVVADCSTGSVKTQPLSSSEESLLSNLLQAAAKEETARKAADTQRLADLATLKAFASDAKNADPVWAAIARLLGAM